MTKGIFNGSFKEAEAGVRAVVYAVLLLIPFFVMKIPKLIFDSSYEGTIEKIYTDDGVGNTNKAIMKIQNPRHSVGDFLDLYGIIA